MIDLALSARASRRDIMMKIRFPNALPNLFAGAKIGISFALIGAIVGEFVAGEKGLGSGDPDEPGTFNSARAFAAILLLGVIGTVMFYIVEALETWSCRGTCPSAAAGHRDARATKRPHRHNGSDMKPALFDYHAPTTVAAAVDLLGRFGGDARLLAGGQTLVPMMNFRLAAPAVVVDLNRVDGLDFIELHDGVVRIGAMTRQRTIEFSPLVARELPLLADVIRMVGHLPTRSRGTIGGSLANADSAAELPMVLQVLEGEVVVAGPNGRRTIKAADLFVDAMITTIADDEILVEVRLPVMSPETCFASRFSRRRGDFAIAAVAAVMSVEDGRCKTVRLATAGVSATPTRLTEAEAILTGKMLDAETIALAGAAAAREIDPVSDRNASGAYRRHLAGALTARVIEKAARREC